MEARSSLLTRCRPGEAQIQLEAGGNYLRTALAAGAASTRLVVLVGDIEPNLFDRGQGDIPRYDYRVPITSVVSDANASLHRVVAPPAGSHQPQDRISPMQEFWYIALVWTADGRWDFIWADKRTDGPDFVLGDDGQAQRLTSKARSIELTVRRLTCVDDDLFQYDDVFDEDMTFCLALQGAGGSELARDTFTWTDMEEGSLTDPHLSLEWVSPDWEGGSDSDEALMVLSAPLEARAELPLPIADGSPYRLTKMRLKGAGIDGVPGFYADVDVTVSYR